MKTTESTTIDQAFWNRLYQTVRKHSSLSHEAAEDMTQEILCKLLERGALVRFQEEAENESHLFALLKTTTRREIINRYHHAAAEKRRGWTERVSLDDEDLAFEPQSAYHNEQAYQRVEELASHSEELLGDEFRKRGSEQHFEVLRVSLVRESSPIDYAGMAQRSGKSEATLRVDLCRARRRYQEIVREQLALAA